MSAMELWVAGSGEHPGERAGNGERANADRRGTQRVERGVEVGG